MKKVLVTGAAGFIGSNFVHLIDREPNLFKEFEFCFLDALTYAGRLKNIENLINKNPLFSFVQVDIRELGTLRELFHKEKFDGVIHYAAESHVDNSISSPGIFVETNVLGTQNLLSCSLERFKENPEFRFLQVSTDEVYGELDREEPASPKKHPISPNSPYSASKCRWRPSGSSFSRNFTGFQR